MFGGFASSEMGVDAAKAEGFHRRRELRLRDLREIVAILGVETYGQQVRGIAGRLQKNPKSVSRWVAAAAERRSSDSDSGFARRLRDLDEARWVMDSRGRYECCEVVIPGTIPIRARLHKRFPLPPPTVVHSIYRHAAKPCA